MGYGLLGGGSAGHAPAPVWAGAFLAPMHPTVDHLAAWGVGNGHTCQPRQVLKNCMVPGDRGLRARFSARCPGAPGGALDPTRAPPSGGGGGG